MLYKVVCIQHSRHERTLIRSVNVLEGGVEIVWTSFEERMKVNNRTLPTDNSRPPIAAFCIWKPRDAFLTNGMLEAFVEMRLCCLHGKNVGLELLEVNCLWSKGIKIAIQPFGSVWMTTLVVVDKNAVDTRIQESLTYPGVRTNQNVGIQPNNPIVAIKPSIFFCRGVHHGSHCSDLFLPGYHFISGVAG